MKFPFLGGAYSGRSSNLDAQTCINLLVEGDPTTPEGNSLVGTPGYQQQEQSPYTTAVIRGMLMAPEPVGLLFVVIGNRLYQYSPTADVWSRLDNVAGFTWDMLTSTGPVSMAYMGLSGTTWAVCVADGNKPNVYESAGPTATVIATPATANTVTFLDGRFILDDASSAGRFYYSGILAPTTYTALAFATAEGAPDALKAVFSDRRELYLFGDVTTEIWYDAGDVNNPFQRYQGGFIQTGLAAKYSIARLDNTIVWLATDERGKPYVALMGPNYQPLTISTPQINYLLQNYSVVRDAFAVSYRLGGHECYVLTFPTQNITWVYDAVTKEWHQWRSGESGKHLMQCMAAVADATANYGTWLGTTAADGYLYKLSTTKYVDDTSTATQTPIFRERTSHHVMDDQKRVSLSELQLDMEEGTATTIQRNSTINAVAAVGATSVVTVTTTAITAGSTVAIVLDDGRVHVTTCSAGVTGGVATVTFDDGLPGPVSGTTANIFKSFNSDVCTLEYSKDGGQSYGTATSLHIGVYNTTTTTIDTRKRRVLLRRLGMARQWTVRFKTSAAVKIVIRGLLAKVWGAAE